ncbi:threonine--tRNA ligase [Candidatus Woesebacteria bacterium RIFOXYC1_FULL_31_51]|uniref:Threonine--tRNA ligase n=1 Tax=Candidatus Woesebacteria bacterium GW2011_GWC2_31_9 TaxID=1618586 RepID=A0A0G0BKF1_9BACT|nr:MAG: threonyl-tRNA synthetase, threonyl-tRNA synthetase [Candidatus Woesebacteria bacterium GW2011_GWF1_31_35]KKP22685.1 MAG: Threonine-tRNA ligase [Candidatus Woesebacteria bacterium GW2011_GWC1_30_29]KKP25932.1 MAG: Threonine-tRNA ligase [Candidatus Woesebacteria bacterium GW2011_GWD1_31_12]KKP27158.1 MAG: Threonine-tRNA ligase [Candidatus Woesebacteria bacterium GW2011_GWB1_31_29]KKP31537.1 MAG: Threonine-tRNA ligase [Candidatus Woesebacteria bacterium GW2011_GWC2_31_9]KKP33949.1 MAG: Th
MSKVLDEKLTKMTLEEQKLWALRHTAEHILHTSLQNLYPKLKKAMGPATPDGFYNDFDFDEKITEADFEKIEKEMKRLINLDLPMIQEDVKIEEAKKIFKNNPYKLEWIDEIEKRGEKVSTYKMGDEEIDLCSGPHLNSTGEVKAFKLLSVAGAYWHGDEKNKMLQRVYGTAFYSQKELANYLYQIEEAKKRDHKKLGQELELFMFHNTSPGMPYWLPKGLTIYNELVKFWRIEHIKRGYQEIMSPILNKKELYITSGHYDHYWSEMFVAKTEDEGEYGVKAMNCPNAHIVFDHKNRSYRDLPLRLSDTDPLHRYERSGTLNGLLRVREFRQDDAHIYVSEDQIESEYKNVFEIVKKFYSIFDINYSFRLGTRNPENFMGDVKTWDKAEKTLNKILKESGIEYEILDGDGAFYGPKIDILMKDSLGRSWQMGTIQLDFQQPRRFKLQYIDKGGSLKTPIAIHRVIYGSLERFIGILIEHFAGNFPTWLTPVQVKILPLTERNLNYANSIFKKLRDDGIRVEIDERNETLGEKIRNAQMEKISYMLIVGDKEEKEKTISVRCRDGKSLENDSLEDFIRIIKKEIEEKLIN